MTSLQDSRLRKINYLRLSVTDRCNLRCSYCMPAEGLPIMDRGDMMTRQEILKVAETAVRLGIRKIRITGGEPTVRPDIVPLLGDLGQLPGLDRLVITTNGLRMEALAADLFSAGVHGANISIDSLNTVKFREITRGGDLNRCLRGIDASIAAGLLTKLNVVVMAGVNDNEAPDFLEFARTRPISVRFIEYMPMRERENSPSLTLPTAELLERLARTTTLEPIDPPGGLLMAGPARNFSMPGYEGTMGVISPMTCNFCDDCNRIRVTAKGLARGCLFHEVGLDLKPWLRSGDDEGLANALVQVVADKPASHQLDENVGGDPIHMSRMGG